MPEVPSTARQLPTGYAAQRGTAKRSAGRELESARRGRLLGYFTAVLVELGGEMELSKQRPNPDDSPQRKKLTRDGAGAPEGLAMAKLAKLSNKFKLVQTNHSYRQPTKEPSSANQPA